MTTETAQRIRSRWSRAGHHTTLESSKGTPIDMLNFRSDSYGVGLQWNAPWLASGDSQLRYVLWDLRNKSRLLEVANPYAERFFHELEANVLSSEGMTLQMQIVQEKDITLNGGIVIPAGSPDKGANSAIEDGWYQFWHETGNCDVTGCLSGIDLDKLWLRATARDGDCLVRIVRGFDNDWKFALQLFEGDQLDPNYNAVLPSGNEVRMSVELDKWGRRVAYHVAPYIPGGWQTSYGSWSGTTDPLSGGSSNLWSTGAVNIGERIRIPAEECIFIYPRKRIGQSRGWPWLTPVMDMLHSLSKYEEAELVATRAAAEKMGFLYQTMDAEGEGFTGATTTATGHRVLDSVPGQIQPLDPGWRFEGWNPNHPNGNYGDYRKGVLRQIASGLGVSYNILANDLENVNYSSLRGGLLDERELYKMIQRWYIDNAKMIVFKAWLEMALLGGKIKLDNGSALPATKIDKFNNAFFQGRRWPWVDPLKDITASILSVDNGFKSRRQIIAENGGYVEDTFDEIEQDEELARDRGEDGEGNPKPPLLFGGQAILKVQSPLRQENIPPADVSTGDPALDTNQPADATQAEQPQKPARGRAIQKSLIKDLTEAANEEEEDAAVAKLASLLVVRKRKAPAK